MNRIPKAVYTKELREEAVKLGAAITRGAALAVVAGTAGGQGARRTSVPFIEA